MIRAETVLMYALQKTRLRVGFFDLQSFGLGFQKDSGSEQLFNILDLLPHLLDQHLELHR